MFVILNKIHHVMTKENDNATYQKVVAEETVDNPPGNEMIVPSKAKGKNLYKLCFDSGMFFVETHKLLVARLLDENRQSIPARECILILQIKMYELKREQ